MHKSHVLCGIIKSILFLYKLNSNMEFAPAFWSITAISPAVATATGFLFFVCFLFSKLGSEKRVFPWIPICTIFTELCHSQNIPSGSVTYECWIISFPVSSSLAPVLIRRAVVIKSLRYQGKC